MQIMTIIAGIVQRDDTFLITRKAYQKWEFPGRKLLLGQDETRCLHRELYEDFGIDARIGNCMGIYNFEYKNEYIQIKAYTVPYFIGNFILDDGQEIRWVNKKQLDKIDFQQPDKPIVDIIKKMF